MSERKKSDMNINKVILCGRTGREAKTSGTVNGRNISRVSVATTKRYKDAQEQWQEKTQWHTCVGYGPVGDALAKIPTGALVFIEAELAYREYERTVETEGGPVKVMWPVTEVVIESFSVIDRNDRSEKRGAA
jgi:single stranded DNA-binding protein